MEIVRAIKQPSSTQPALCKATTQAVSALFSLIITIITAASADRIVGSIFRKIPNEMVNATPKQNITT